MNKLRHREPAQAAPRIPSRDALPPQVQVALDAAEAAGLGIEPAATTGHDYVFVYGDPSIPSPVFRLLDAVGFALRVETHDDGRRVVAVYVTR